ncbi:unnamed protein product [Camellia sinensis]
MGEGRERRLGEKKFKTTIGRKSLLPAVAASTRMSSALSRRLGIGRSRNMSIFATIDKWYPPNDWLVGSSLPPKFSPTIIESTLNELTPNNVRKAICKDPTDSKEVPPLDVPELLAYLVRQSGPFLDQIGVRRG